MYSKERLLQDPGDLFFNFIIFPSDKVTINGIEIHTNNVSENNHTHTAVLLLKELLISAYFGTTSAVLTKFTAEGLPERFKSPA